MQWTAPSENHTGRAALEKRLGDAADSFRANFDLKSRKYAPPARDVLVTLPLDSDFTFSGFSSARSVALTHPTIPLK
jgi:hypothetical protein